jgi:uncharacterized membrane protein YkoI
MLAAISMAAAGVGVRAMADGTKGLADQATVTLEAAMARAAQEAKDGTIVKAELEKEDGRLVYSFDIAVGTRILELHVDAGDGAIVAREDEAEDKSGLTGAKVSLADAVKAALAAAPGKAVSAEIEKDGTRRAIEVKVVSNGKTREVEVDAETGAVVVE